MDSYIKHENHVLYRRFNLTTMQVCQNSLGKISEREICKNSLGFSKHVYSEYTIYEDNWIFVENCTKIICSNYDLTG